ncbi:MAG TPA: hypothetical protein VK590_13050 [Saprospiraceae bacterium]|nr:hypothetical protein [Saprospiraceae bacterium]
MTVPKKLPANDIGMISIKIAKKTHKCFIKKTDNELDLLKKKCDQIDKDDYITLISKALAMVNANVLHSFTKIDKEFLKKDKFIHLVDYFFKSTADALHELQNIYEREKMN